MPTLLGALVVLVVYLSHSKDEPIGDLPGTVPVAGDTVVVRPESAAVFVKGQITLAAAVLDSAHRPRAGAKVAFTSSDTLVARVVPNTGVVTGLKKGLVTITASAANAAPGLAKIAVRLPVTSVQLSPRYDTLVLGDTVRLKATVRDSAGAVVTDREVAWSTTNDTIATVSANGLVRARTKPGPVGIHVIVEGRHNEDTLQVVDMQVVPSTLSLKAKIQGQVLKARFIGSEDPGDTLYKRAVRWRSLDTTIATVTANGLVFPERVGTTRIALTSTRATGIVARHAKVTVTSPPLSVGVGECQNPPSEWLWCDNFETNRFMRYIAYDNAGGRFKTIVFWGGGLTNMVLEARFPANGRRAGALMLDVGPSPLRASPFGGDSTRHRELFWRFYVWYDSNWTGGAGGRLTSASAIATRGWAEAMRALVRQAGNADSARDALAIDPMRGTDLTGFVRTRRYNDYRKLHYLGTARGSLPIAADTNRWHCIEAHVKLNTPGNADGVFELWADSTLQASQKNLRFVGPGYNGFTLNLVTIENVLPAGPPAEQRRLYDNFVVSRSQIGCTSQKPM